MNYFVSNCGVLKYTPQVTRNKQLEAQIAHINVCRDEHVNMFQQTYQEVKNRIHALEDAIVKWQEYYSEKASKKHELIRLLKEYKTGGKNEAELTKETIHCKFDREFSLTL